MTDSLSKPLREEIPEVAFTIIENRLGHIDDKIDRISDDIKEMKVLVKETVKAVQEDIGDKEREIAKLSFEVHDRCLAHQPILDAMSEHIKADKPVDHYLGKWALSVVVFVASIAGAFIVNRILNLANM